MYWLYTPVWNVILPILRSQMDFCTMYANDFGISKLTRLHFKQCDCTSFILVRSVQRRGKNMLTSIIALEDVWKKRCLDLTKVFDDYRICSCTAQHFSAWWTSIRRNYSIKKSLFNNFIMWHSHSPIVSKHANYLNCCLEYSENIFLWKLIFQVFILLHIK